MIWTLRIELLFGAYAEEECIRSIEIDSSSTLEDLHLAIQDAVDFDKDHLYEFYISRTERSRDRERFDDENEGLYDVTLENLYPLEKGRKLYYLFDYGDNWIFKITRSRRKPMDAMKGIEYPRVVERVGETRSSIQHTMSSNQAKQGVRRKSPRIGSQRQIEERTSWMKDSFSRFLLRLRP